WVAAYMGTNSTIFFPTPPASPATTMAHPFIRRFPIRSVMRTDTPPTVHRSSYQPFPYRISHVDLQFDLDPEKTTVSTTLNVQRTAGSPVPLVLNGDSLELVEICLDETALQPGSYQLGESELTLHPDAEHFTLRITSTCSPIHNTALMGLYVS